MNHRRLRARRALPKELQRRPALSQETHLRGSAELDQHTYPLTGRVVLLPPLLLAARLNASSAGIRPLTRGTWSAAKAAKPRGGVGDVGGIKGGLSSVHIRRAAQRERDYLIALYEETNGHLHWASPKWPVLDHQDNLGKWAGLAVDGDGLLRILDLRRRRLRGALPAALCTLTRLTEIHLNWNNESWGRCRGCQPASKCFEPSAAVGCRALCQLSRRASRFSISVAAWASSETHPHAFHHSSWTATWKGAGE